MVPVLSILAQTAPDADAVAQAVPDGLTLVDWAVAGLILLAAVLIALVLRRVALRTIGRRSMASAELIGRMTIIVLSVVGFVYALSTIGVQVGLFIGALGIGGIALAFAFQDILENFMAGVILEVKRPFRTGDIVQLGELPHLGIIRDIDSRSVIIDTFSGERIVLPAATVLKSPIENWSVNGRRRLAVKVGVAYGADPIEAARAITERVVTIEEVLPQPEPRTLLEEFADSSVSLIVYVWHRADADIFWVKHRVMEEAKTALAEAGIEIPFPQRVVTFVPPSSPSASPSGDGHDTEDQAR